MKNTYLLAIFSGILLALGWPTYGFPIVLFIAFVPLLIAEKKIRLNKKIKRRGLKVFATGYLSFVVWNAITTWWLWYSTAFGMFFAILVNALIMAFVFLIFHYVARKLPRKIHLIFLPVVWIAFEKFHLNWVFSWPWLNLGNAFSEHTIWIQWYEYTGTFGGSLWIWIINIGLFKTIEKHKESGVKRYLSLGIAKNLILIAIPIIISLFIFKNYEEPNKKATIVIVQPNVDPYTEKYNDKNEDTAMDIIALAMSDLSPQTDFIIAPETTLAQGTAIDKFEYSRSKYILQSITRQYPKINIITGVDFFKLYQQREKPTPSANKTSRGDWYDVYNAAVLINKTEEVQYYIKSKLVVGVETFPFKNILEPLLGNVMIDLGGTIASRATQNERAVLTDKEKKYKAAPIICYESVYGEFVTDYIKKDANFLAIITNDAWWDKTQGHKQHLSYAKLRAIETRRSIARSANTGISAFINQKGEILDTLAYGTKGVLSGEISINNKQTFYVKYGDYIARLSTFIAGFIFLFAIAKKKR
ncbi:apolipoprotein N-acyltransferase [Leptobacterium sp. I13]|uniref:apolipoprotein N-acyltransferase n=1 Tax=Leptobacterium meishanense TaxID=3128904 RepID=UPI0030ECDFB0